MINILLVDDDSTVASILKRKISEAIHECECTTALDFGEALSTLSTTQYDLIIIDNILSYPGEGRDLAEQIKVLPLNNNTEIWIISGDFEKESESEGVTLMPKPLTPEHSKVFLNKLSKWNNL